MQKRLKVMEAQNNMGESFSLALKSIWSNKTRSFLTMLGIIIGVGAVIILVSLVNGYMSYMTESFTSMGTNQINVELVNISTRFVTDDEMYKFYDEHSDLFVQMTPQVQVSGNVKTSTGSLSATRVSGVGEEYAEMKDYKMAAGRFVSYSDNATRQKVAVIGYYDACELFGSAENAVGEKIKINGYAYKVVGVVERQDEDDLEEGGDDDMVFLPYASALKLSRNSIPSSYVFATADTSKSDEAVQVIEDYLESVYQNDNLYTVTAMSELLDSLNEMIDMMSLLLGGIAGISLLVAGVGVMNIMLVSVTERTREIGIRKALGARRFAIMSQFVIEAAVTSVLGGIIGIVFGAGMSELIGKLIGIDAPPTFGAVVISFAVSVAIGLIFGYMPANRAARLNPIDALRSE